MDCKTARLLLEFDRPAAGELAGADSVALHDHLVHCPDCEPQALNERRLDAHLGRAMRQVEVPDRLHGQILNRLRAERRAYYRRWVVRGLRAAAVAAVLLLGVWGWAHWHRPTLPVLDPEQTLEAVNGPRRDPEEVQNFLRDMTKVKVQEAFHRMDVTVPDDLDYVYLAGQGMSELPGYEGTKVPFLIFAGPHEHALVYIVSAKQFDLKLLTTQNPGPSGKRYNLEIRYEPGSSQACLIFYTGGSLRWLKTTIDAV